MSSAASPVKTEKIANGDVPAARAPAASAASASSVHAFPSISLGNSSGVLKMNKVGMGWKGAATGATESVTGAEISDAHWRVMGKARQLSLTLSSGASLAFDGFRKEDEQFLSEFFRDAYNVPLTVDEEPPVDGWNWLEEHPQVDRVTGTLDCGPSFSVPQTLLLSSAVPERRGRSVGAPATELVLQLAPVDATGAPLPGGEDAAVRKDTPANARVDCLVSMKLYVPPEKLATSLSTQLAEAADRLGDAAGAGGAAAAAAAAAEDEEPAADAVVFPDLNLITPRGHMAVTVGKKRLKLQAKSRSYTLRTRDIARLFALPKPDGQSVIVVLSLASGVSSTTTYPHVVIQVARDLKTPDGQQPLYKHLVAVLREAVGQRPTVPGKFRSAGDNYQLEEEEKQADGTVKLVRREVLSSAIRCSLKADTGHLYLLEQSFFFLFKPPTYYRYDQVDHVEFQRVGNQGGAGTRSFDLLLHLKKDGSAPVQFLGIELNELRPLVKWFSKKGLKYEGIDDAVSSHDEDEDDDEGKGESAGPSAPAPTSRKRRAAAAAADLGIRAELREEGGLKKKVKKEEKQTQIAGGSEDESDDDDFGDAQDDEEEEDSFEHKEEASDDDDDNDDDDDDDDDDNDDDDDGMKKEKKDE